MEAIESLIEMFHSVSLIVIVLLIVITLVVSYMMVRVFRGDFENHTSQF